MVAQPKLLRELIFISTGFQLRHRRIPTRLTIESFIPSGPDLSRYIMEKLNKCANSMSNLFFNNKQNGNNIPNCN